MSSQENSESSKLKNTFFFKQLIIFNGKIKSNIPYYYMSYKDVRYLFLPGMVIIVNKNESKVLPTNEISIKKDGLEYHLLYQNNDLLSFKSNIDFDINFFYFKY